MASSPTATGAPALELRGASVRYGAAVAVDDVDVDVSAGEVLALLGPSGCGKSSLLRGVAGLEPLADGAVLVGGRDLSTVPVHDRGIGLMFQDYALFPHRDVQANVAFGLRMQGARGQEMTRRVDEALALVGLSGAGDRSVTSLSGGEQQRVALARALAPRPGVLLLDEPLGSLDRDLRQRLLGELGAILAGLDVATIYVTHDQDEAFALGDRVAIMRAGRIVRNDAPEQLWRSPRTAFVAGFLGLGTVIPASASGGRAPTPWGSAIATALDGDVSLVVRPAAVSIDPDADVRAEVVSRHFRDGSYTVGLATSFGVLTAELPPLTPAPSPRQVVTLRIDERSVDVVEGHHGNSA